MITTAPLPRFTYTRFATTEKPGSKSTSEITTYTGAKIDPLDPRPENKEIHDIAHALSVIPRFLGHGRKPFSVAQHSILVTSYLPYDLGLWGLLHDAAEAYIGDLPGPIKHDPRLIAFREADARIQACIFSRFRVQTDSALCRRRVKWADERTLYAESLANNAKTVGQNGYVNAIPAAIWPRPPEEVERLFLDKFTEFGGIA